MLFEPFFGEIDHIIQFHQNVIASFFCCFPYAKKLQTQTVSTEKLRITFTYKKAACKMMVKLIPAVFLSFRIQKREEDKVIIKISTKF